MKRKYFSVEQIVAVLKQADQACRWRTSSGKSGFWSRRFTVGRSNMHVCSRTALDRLAAQRKAPKYVFVETPEEARAIIEAWRRDHDESRPHMTLNGPSPAEFNHAAGLAGRQHG